MTITAAKRQQYLDWIDAAETALQELVTTGREQVIRYGEKEVQYAPTDMKKLENYIAYLRRQVGTQRRVLLITPH